MIRRLVFSIVLVLVLIGVGMFFLVKHARDTVVKAAEAKAPSLPGIKPAASFSSLSFDAGSLVTVEFKLGYTVGDSTEMKEIPGVGYASWRAKPWDDVSFGLTK